MLLCHGMACYVTGSQALVQELKDTWGIQDGGTTADGELSVQVVNGCLGVCDRAPLVKLDADFHGELTVESLNDVLRRAIAGGGGWRDAHHGPSLHGDHAVAANGSHHGTTD
jgi:NADH:ubiquinone oxidoreductase subunit E